MRLAQPTPVLGGEGLSTFLDTRDFDHWRDVVCRTLGDHSSDLHGSPKAFSALARAGAAGPFTLLHLSGSGVIQLNRVQSPTQAVLWLPLQGMTQEIVNGEDLVAEPGMAMLMQPGDRLEGRTSRQLEGISILIPPERVRPGMPGLLHRGKTDQAVIDAGWCFAKALATAPCNTANAAAAQLGNALETWCMAVEAHQKDPQAEMATHRRHRYVQSGCTWITDHLEEPFDITELAKAVGVSTRTLQYAFLQELGHSPMAEAKRLRLHRLRQRLLNPDDCTRSIAELMTASGLLACGATAIDYRRRFGESPRQSRMALKNWR